ncbi:HNH endonuclease [Pseudomonas sp. GM79]|uniref:HNH endonuclease n=1 Tax=Pseudomonas sp. GM79 TaxID=1144338 RepID=UPI00026F5923|nr:HNH endonuclease domain-containing protein [Pseudomonas sp. GM79]EJN22621.1 HNH endonuclease [Pseudomonas sp. GM79]
MPLINSAVTFSPEAILKIATVKSEPQLSHTRWGDDDLEELRREIRNFYRREQKLTCAYCKEEIGVIAAANAPIEHILPKSKYIQFMFEPKNLCVICADCNTYKKDREGLLDPPLYRDAVRIYPLDSSRYRLFHPHFDEYDQHIKKIRYIYLPGSNKGSYTIFACNLNRVIVELGVSDELFNDVATALERARFGGNG